MACEIEFRWEDRNKEKEGAISSFVKDLAKNTDGLLKYSFEDGIYRAVIETECDEISEKMSAPKSVPMPISIVKRYKN